MDLALQGGGAHGAFTWGVLDRLLEEPWLRIEGISGTSAGAMNAAVLIDGRAEGSRRREGAARAVLEKRFAGRTAQSLPPQPSRHHAREVDARLIAMFIAFDLMVRIFSPYDLNPHGQTPCAKSWQSASISSAWPKHRSSYS
jgi:NTE family protein